MKTLSDKISDGALCEYGNVLLIEDVKQKMDDIKEEILDYFERDDLPQRGKNVIEIINKHLGKELKWLKNVYFVVLKLIIGIYRG